MTEQLEVLDLRQNLEVKDQIQIISSAIKEGQVDAAKAGVFLKRIGKIAEDVLKDKDVKSAIERETLKYIAEGGNVFGAKVTHCAVYTAYDFKGCGHTELDSLYAIQNEVKERIKDIEEELKLTIPKEKLGADFGINKTKTIVIENTYELNRTPSGEVIDVKPPIKYQSEGLKYMKL